MRLVPSSPPRDRIRPTQVKPQTPNGRLYVAFPRLYQMGFSSQAPVILREQGFVRRVRM
ncbi:protein of unknown function [Cupriavidus taiwanensis]|nr:protein of unknown function [Cupriavidus taiwanensis]